MDIEKLKIKPYEINTTTGRIILPKIDPGKAPVREPGETLTPPQMPPPVPVVVPPDAYEESEIEPQPPMPAQAEQLPPSKTGMIPASNPQQAVPPVPPSRMHVMMPSANQRMAARERASSVPPMLYLALIVIAILLSGGGVILFKMHQQQITLEKEFLALKEDLETDQSKLSKHRKDLGRSVEKVETILSNIQSLNSFVVGHENKLEELRREITTLKSDLNQAVYVPISPSAETSPLPQQEQQADVGEFETPAAQAEQTPEEEIVQQ